MNNWFASTSRSISSNSSPRTAVEEPAEALNVERPFDLTEQHFQGGDNVDALLASALGDLSLQERDKVYHEVHGVDEMVVETLQFVKEKLHAFENELLYLLQRQSYKKTQAYQLAASQNPHYLQNLKFRLTFLRAERFDAFKAADRFLRFFDLKWHIFGPHKLCKDITLEDLDAEDMKTLKAGFMQVLPVRDRAGRAVCMLIPNYQTYKDHLNFIRVMYYMIMSVLEDEETQKRGITTIVDSVAGEFVNGKTDLRTVSAGPWLVRSLPFRIVAIHQCFNNPAVRLVIRFSLRFLHEKDRARTKLHYGTHVECIYALMTYGIPTDALPVTVDGDLKRKNHLDWIKVRNFQERNLPPNTTRIIIPSLSDIKFGRGKPFREHVGNMRLHQLLDDKLPEYSAAARLQDKTAMIKEIVDTIRAEGARFLKQESPQLPWLEVDEKQAKEKVSHGFRSRLKTKIASENSDSSEHQHRRPSSSTAMMSGTTRRRSHHQSGADSTDDADERSQASSISRRSARPSPTSSPLFDPNEIGPTLEEEELQGFQEEVTTKRPRFDSMEE